MNAASEIDQVQLVLDLTYSPNEDTIVDYRLSVNNNLVASGALNGTRLMLASGLAGVLLDVAPYDAVM